MAGLLNRAEFLQVLNRVQPGLSTRAFIEQSNCFIFYGGWVSTYNVEICCRAKTGLPKAFEGAVLAAPLLKVLEAMPHDEISVDFTDDELLLNKTSRTKAGIRMQKEILLPVDDVTTPGRGEWRDLHPDFGDAVKKVVGAAGSNDEEFITVCVNVHPNWIEACDRKQVARWTLDTGVTEPFLVRASSLEHVVPFGLTQIGETDEWVHFRNESLIFSCRRHLEEYWDLAPMLEFDGDPAEFPSGADKAAKMGGIFCETKKDKLICNMKRGRLHVKGQSATGWASDDLDMKYDGEEVEFAILPKMLIQLVANSKQCQIGGRKLCVSGDHWKYVTGLAEVDQKKKTAKPEPEPVAVGANEDAGDDD